MNRVLIEPCIRNKRFGFEAASSIENTFSYDLATLNHALRAGLWSATTSFIPTHPGITRMLMLRNKYQSGSHHACGVINCVAGKLVKISGQNSSLRWCVAGKFDATLLFENTKSTFAFSSGVKISG